jgi:hypothetical protein
VLPSDEPAASLAELVSDAAAIPGAAFSVSKCAARRVIDLTTPAKRTVLQIPAATISLLEAAEEHISSLSR